MGVRNILKWLRERGLYERMTLEAMSRLQSVISIDAMSFVHRLAHRAKGERDVMMTHFRNMGRLLRTRNLEPVFVFDGPRPCVAKARETQRRREQKKRRIARSISTSSSSAPVVIVNGDLIAFAMRGLVDAGFDVRRAKHDGEKLCANNFRLILSEDSDVLFHGGDYLCTKFDETSETCIVYDRRRILHDIQLDQKRFVELAMGLGCDICETRMLRLTADKLVGLLRKKYDSLESIYNIEFGGKIAITKGRSYETMCAEIRRARAIFHDREIMSDRMTTESCPTRSLCTRSTSSTPRADVAASDAETERPSSASRSNETDESARSDCAAPSK